MSVFSIDGVSYPRILVTDLSRNFEVLDGPNTERVLTGDMVRDIIGTYYNYTLELDTSELSVTEYDALYEVVSAPVASHTLVVPYGQGDYSFKAYVTSGGDSLLSMTGKRNLWGELSLSFIAMSPARRA